MRDMIYSFAGCVMEGAPFLRPFLPGCTTSTRGMSTEGVLRLLNGETLSIDDDQKQQMFITHKGLPYNYGTYFGIDSIDGILWTPLSDAIFLVPLARCTDRTTYPFYDGFIDNVLGSTHTSLSSVVIRSLWEQLHKATMKIGHRGIIYYPTDHLQSSAWKSRIDNIQQLAMEMFSDWHHFTIEPELDNSGYWAHYSDRAKHKLWQQIEKVFG